jgi:hypothetical protein
MWNNNEGARAPPPIFFAATATQLKDSSWLLTTQEGKCERVYLPTQTPSQSFMIEEYEIAYPRMMPRSKIGRKISRTPA